MPLFPYMAQSGNSESLEWKTDVIKSKAGEQRFALREAPRQIVNYTYIFTQLEYSQAKAIIYGTTQDNFKLPIWNDLQEYSSWASGDHYEILPKQNEGVFTHGTEALLWESKTKYELVSIINDNWGNLWGVAWGGTDTIYIRGNTLTSYSPGIVAPVKDIRIVDGINGVRKRHDLIAASVNCLVKNNFDFNSINYYPSYTSPYFQYRNHDVLTDFIMSDSSNESIYPEVEIIDNSIGQQFVDNKYIIPKIDQVMTWDLTTKVELYNLRKFIHSKKGKQKSFWAPSWGKDFNVTTNINMSDVVIDVTSIDYPIYYGIRDVMILLNDGTKFYRRINSAVTVGGTDQLTIDSALGQGVLISEIERVSFLTLMRFNSDRIEFKHSVNSNTRISIPVTEVITQ